MKKFLFFAGMAFGVLMPVVASAQIGALDGIVNFVVSGTPLTRTISGSGVVCSPLAGAGACKLAALLVYAVARSRSIVGALALLMIVVAGFRLIISQDEQALATARRAVAASVLGLFLIFTVEPFVDSFYGGFSIPASMAMSTPVLAANILSAEIYGILRWGETLVAIVAITLMVVQAVAVFGSFGQEETIRKAYRAILYTVIGLLLVVFDRTIAAIFGYDTLGAFPGSPNVSIFIVEIFGIVRLVLGFVGIIAVAAIIYSGFLMILNYGNDEFITRAKGVLINAGLGLLLIIVSFVIVSTIILGLA